MTPLFALFSSMAFVRILIIAVGLSVMIGAFALIRIARFRTDPLRRRLAGLKPAEGADPERNTAKLGSVLQPLAPYLLPRRDAERETLLLRLERAGFRSKGAAINLYATQLVLIVGLTVPFTFWMLHSTSLGPINVVFLATVAAFVGMAGPNMYLRHRVLSRQREILNALPDALDLLVSCTEAGLGLNGALQRVARQIGISSRLLADELEQVNAEIRTGIDRIVALRNLAHRTGIEDIRGLVSVLAQSMRFGSPIAQILRIYAEEFRDKRAQSAEERAAMVGTKLIFPLVFCIFPSFFVVAVGPAWISLFHALAGTSVVH